MTAKQPPQLNAIITGSTSGIGLAIAEKFAQSGMNVCLNGFGDKNEIEAIRCRLQDAYQIKAHYSGADMSHEDQIKQMVEEAQNALGEITVLVNNAGIQHVSPVEDFPTDKWNQILAINLTSNFHTVKALVPGMKKNGFGRIINIASAHAKAASPYKAAYVAAKHGVAGFTKTIALELAETGITANAICPGYVRTPLVEQQIPDTANARGITEEAVIKDVLLAAQPTKKFVETHEIAALALFLCQADAASITGSILSIDGGWTAK